MEIIPTGEKSGVKLEDYKGFYSLTAQSENNGKYWPVWAKYKKGKDGYMDKDWPVRVVLGDRKTAIGVLQMVLRELGEDTPF
jgi:hypothetical protein